MKWRSATCDRCGIPLDRYKRAFNLCRLCNCLFHKTMQDGKSRPQERQGAALEGWKVDRDSEGQRRARKVKIRKGRLLVVMSIATYMVLAYEVGSRWEWWLGLPATKDVVLSGLSMIVVLIAVVFVIMCVWLALWQLWIWLTS